MSEKISVVVPVYGVQQYLARAVDSLLGQTYQNLQIILVDDGSPDRCGEICDAYARQDSRVTVIHKENGGLSSARNAGLEVADGAYIAFLDSDDYFQSAMLERLYTAAKDRDLEITQCDFYRFSQSPESCPQEGPVQMVTSQQALERIDHPVYMAAWNKLYKAELFSDVRFPHGKIHEDVATTYRLFHKAQRIGTISDALYGYFENPDSITTGKIKLNKLDLIDAYLEQALFFREKGMKANYIRSANNLAAVFGTLLCYEKNRYADYEGFAGKLQEKFVLARREVLSHAPLRWDLRLANFLSMGNVRVMGAYHALKQRL